MTHRKEPARFYGSALSVRRNDLSISTCDSDVPHDELVGAHAEKLALGMLAGCGHRNTGKDTYDENGRLILNLKNVYFDTWEGSDTYTEMLNEKFGVKVKASNYDYNEWDGMVNTAINGNNLTDTIQFNSSKP